jgi:hypothetical protein
MEFGSGGLVTRMEDSVKNARQKGAIPGIYLSHNPERNGSEIGAQQCATVALCVLCLEK